MVLLPATLARGGTAAQLAAGPLLPFPDGRRPGADGDALLDHCCDAWNKLEAQPWTIMSIGLRDWAHRF